MLINKFTLRNIPAVLWGKKSDKLIIAIHGNKSSKTDDCIRILAEEAEKSGCQVLSFDLPDHGERIGQGPCMVWNCVRELKDVLAYAKSVADTIYVFGCSMGAYFSLLAYKDEKIKHALFLSPVTDMERIIRNIMHQLQVAEEELQKQKIIENPIETLYWDYYSFVKEHPVDRWNHPTSILYGEHDTMCEYKYVSAFAEKYHCDMEVEKGGEHWFHTPEELAYYRQWLSRKL